MKPRILIASDHAGYELKARLEPVLEKLGYEVVDLGRNSAEATDYARQGQLEADRAARKK